MKKIKLITILIILIIIIQSLIISQSYAIAEDQEQENENKFDVNDLVVKDEKYLEEHYTASGTKYTIIGELKIDKIDIDYPILSDTSTELLSISLNKYWGADPNEVGNLCIVGHNYANLTHFGKLSRLELRRRSRNNRFIWTKT